MKKKLLILIGLIGLGLTLIPSIPVFAARISQETHRTLMFIGTIIFLAITPFWLAKSGR